MIAIQQLKKILPVWILLLIAGMPTTGNGQPNPTYGTDTNQTTILELKDLNGDRVGIVFREAQTDDFSAKNVILGHRNISGPGVALLQLIRQQDGKVTDFLPYGDDRRTFRYWNDLTEKFVSIIDSVVPSGNKTYPESNPVSANEDHRPFALRLGGNPIWIKVHSDTLKKARDGTAMLFALEPNKVTAIGYVGAEGLVLIDKLGGNKGVRLTPFGPAMVIPADPKEFAKNAGKLAVNPLDQAKFYGQALEDFAKSIPGGSDLSKPFGFIKVAIQQMGNLPILHTTVGKALVTWSNDPATALAKTLGPLAEVKIGGTTINHAKRSWEENPAKAAVKTLKSLKPW